MKELIIRYKHGDTEFGYKRASAAMVRQVLEAIREDLLPICGDYDWTLDGEPGAYRVRAFWKGQTWTESRGKTPADALENFRAARVVLAENYGIERGQ